jgi:hypothetical protein
VGYPAEAPQLSMRLPLSVTVHRNTFLEDGLDDAIEAYDRRREAAQPYAAQRYVREFGLAEPMAGRRTRRGNMRSPSARISAPM